MDAAAGIRRPPLPRGPSLLRRSLVAATCVLGFVGSGLVMIGGAPSEPCPTVHVDPSCGGGLPQRALAIIGLVTICLALTSGLFARSLRRRWAAMWRFNPPP